MGMRRMFLKRTKVSSEGNMLLIGNPLVRKDQHKIFHPSLVQGVEHLMLERRGQINPKYHGSNLRIKTLN
tara:strand:- start:236 stop:445 length:210 start_codon:yes stop_codon:yes gene_type:complete